MKVLRKKVLGSFCNVDVYDSGIFFWFVKKFNCVYFGVVFLEDVVEVNFDYYCGYDFIRLMFDEDVV